MAIQERNDRFAEQGQPEWAHYCEKCIRFFGKRDGRPEFMVCAIVSDGITIGHPCCNVAHCMEPLPNKRSRFCVGHKYLNNKCSVEACSFPIAPDLLTCNNPEHISIFQDYEIRKSANFQQKGQLSLEEEGSLAKSSAETCPQKSAAGNRPLRARFGCRQTHNEQLMVHPCGIIVAWATFFGSETVPQTVAMLKQVFREPGSMPEFFIYDNCCGVYNHLQATNDPLLDAVGCPVNAFHFECKHKASDIICREHCNPSKFPELINADGDWYFNSSKCEQLNSWLRGYQAILREMNADRYDFLLDELIMHKNHALVNDFMVLRGATGKRRQYQTGFKVV
ncbi:hypothetical protein NLJ89_g9962 [Agrocybe chaxingu]|uniref:CxC6 like cysteine cluster associated with KDZ domain-containing protein n=1 Tax=Agrocybe chaxingu TaxID=84603 RepID=A0A9W8JSJ7_9AGAR|nr:hypothetical protein NLJ89_g9962 [Agrocybe chaxingu]